MLVDRQRLSEELYICNQIIIAKDSTIAIKDKMIKNVESMVKVDQVHISELYNANYILEKDKRKWKNVAIGSGIGNLVLILILIL